MLAAGANVKFVTFDENLVDQDLDHGGDAQQVDILYVATHRLNGASGYELGLHADDWPVLAGGFGDRGPVIVVFDCCDLADPAVIDWDRVWRTDKIGPQLRLVLGFASPASVSRQASIRGTDVDAQYILDSRLGLRSDARPGALAQPPVRPAAGAGGGEFIYNANFLRTPDDPPELRADEQPPNFVRRQLLTRVEGLRSVGPGGCLT
ncbi:hypothetical protein ACIA58_38130 [Kribbella sp. NPDC051586]|uniref:hypothetical protein n=1 Tax=Kribbella sp. NPDC051586 TaxID=3364118 RepID=UPI003787DBC2